MTGDADLQHLTFYGDASSQDKRFMVAGGFVVSGNRIQEIEGQVAALRDEAGMRSEFRWANYRGGRRRQAYEGLVDLGFSLIEAQHAAFHVIVAPFGGYNHKAREGESRATSVNRMYYQLCLHRLARYYGKKRAIHVRLDAGNDSSDVCNMRPQLCADAFRKHNTRPNCIRSIEPVNSAKVGILQMSDVLIGAIAAKQNEVNHTSPKAALADYVLERSGRRSWSIGTPMDARFLTIWHFQPSEQVPRGPISKA